MQHRKKWIKQSVFLLITTKVTYSPFTEDIFYRISLVVIDEQANTPERDAKMMISQWVQLYSILR